MSSDDGDDFWGKLLNDIWCLAGLSSRTDLNGMRVRVCTDQPNIGASERLIVNLIDFPERPAISVARKNVRAQEHTTITFDMVHTAIQKMERGDRSFADFEYAMKNSDIFGACDAIGSFTMPTTPQGVEHLLKRIETQEAALFKR